VADWPSPSWRSTCSPAATPDEQVRPQAGPSAARYTALIARHRPNLPIGIGCRSPISRSTSQGSHRMEVCSDGRDQTRHILGGCQPCMKHSGKPRSILVAVHHYPPARRDDWGHCRSHHGAHGAPGVRALLVGSHFWSRRCGEDYEWRVPRWGHGGDGDRPRVVAVRRVFRRDYLWEVPRNFVAFSVGDGARPPSGRAPGSIRTMLPGARPGGEGFRPRDQPT
jgi:hypothetical protein